MIGSLDRLCQRLLGAVDEYRRDAMRTLEQLREAHTLQQIVPDQIPSGRPN